MSSLGKKITQLQRRPYPERLKIFRRLVIAIMILVVLIWIVTLKLRHLPRNGGNNDFQQFQSIFKNFNQFKTQTPRN